MITFKNLNEKINVEGECEEKFGQYLFDIVNGFDWQGREKNTEYEEKLYRKIIKYTFDNNIDKDLKPSLIDLKKCNKYWKDYITPNAKIVYRGLEYGYINDYDILNNIKWNKKKLFNFGYMTGEYIYKPQREIESWTSKFKVAERFSGKSGIILETDVNNTNFMFSTKFLNKVNQNTMVKDEYEIFRMTKNKIKVKIYIKQDMYKKFIDQNHI